MRLEGRPTVSQSRRAERLVGELRKAEEALDDFLAGELGELDNLREADRR